MNLMKRFLTHFLMFIMLMPGLACGPFMTAAKAHAATVQMKGMENCPGMGNMEKTDQKTSSKYGPTFFKDCAHVDLQNADNHASLKNPDLSGSMFVLVFADTVQPERLSPKSVNAIRGPPPDRPALSETQPSVLLTTQRLRV